MKGYNGYEFDPQPGDWVASRDGRSGTYLRYEVEPTSELQTDKQVLLLQTTYGVTLRICEEDVAYHQKKEKI